MAVVFDFLRAMLLGRVVTSTIASGVADINSFTANPELYAYGMICACAAGTFWIAVASRMGVNVSGTHFIGEYSSDFFRVARSTCEYWEFSHWECDNCRVEVRQVWCTIL